MEFKTQDRFATVRGVVKDGSEALSGRLIELRYPVNGVITLSTTSTDANGLFQFNSVPWGNISITAADSPAAGPFSVTVDKPHVMVPAETFNFFGNLQSVTVNSASIGCSSDNVHSIDLVSHYLTTVTADGMTFFWPNAAELTTITLNSVDELTKTGSIPSGTFEDLELDLNIPPGATVPLQLTFDAAMEGKEINGTLEWNSRKDKDNISFKTNTGCP